MELAGDNAIFGPGREVGGGVGELDQGERESPTFIIQNSTEGGSITRAGRRNGDVKEIEGGAAASGFEGRGVNACEFGEAREGL